MFNSLLPFRTSQNVDPKQSHPDQLMPKQNFCRASTLHHLLQYKTVKRIVLPFPFRFRLSRCSSVPSNSGNRLVRTVCQRKKKDTAVQRSGLVKSDRVRNFKPEVAFNNKGVHGFIEKQLTHTCL